MDMNYSPSEDILTLDTALPVSWGTIILYLFELKIYYNNLKRKDDLSSSYNDTRIANSGQSLQPMTRDKKEVPFNMCFI